MPRLRPSPPRRALAAALLLLGLGPGAGRAQQGTTAPPGAAARALDLSARLPEDPAVRHGSLDNGLTYYVRANRKPEARAELWLVVNAGSVVEDDDQQGLAHFLEHMAFNGSEHFAREELVDYLESTGMRFGPDINATTGFDATVYFLQVPTDEAELLDNGLLILHDWADGLTLDPAEVDRERGVVIEEWRLGRGAEARIRDAQLPLLFRGSRYALRLPIGKKEILETAPAGALRRFYHDWYRPDLMAVIAVGDFDAAAMADRIRKRFSDLAGPVEARPRRLYPIPDHADTLVDITTDPEATRSSVAVYTKLPARTFGTVGDYRRSLLEALQERLLNSRFSEIARQGEPPFLAAFAGLSDLVRGKTVYGQFAIARDGAVQRALEALLVEAERVDRFGFLASELERARADLLRGYERAWEERDKQPSRGYADEYRRSFLDGEPFPGIDVELRLVRALLPGITLQEVNRLAQEWITESNRVILVSAPAALAPKLPSRERLLASFEAVRARSIDPWTDRVRQQPLMDPIPAPGRIVAETSVEEVGVLEWTLSNGIRVLLKPTDFRNDQVVMVGWSDGGTSRVPNSRYPSARVATSILQEGGLGAFSRPELEKALAGKVARATPFLGELEEGVSASASPRDLETMFQLVHLTLTAPRLDLEAYEAFRARMKSFLERRSARPETVFEDRFTRTLYQDHPRRQPPGPELLDEIDPRQALTIYRDRFADLGDATFVIVGSFEPDTLRPWVATYLASLPSGSRQESWRDLGIDTPTGVETFEVRRGLEPKSVVHLVFSGEAPFSRRALHEAVSLADALRIRLRQILREDLGATYGVSVAASLEERPRPRYALSIEFGCDPENVTELEESLFRELERFRREGPGAETLSKVREQQRRQRETSLEENGFWLAVLRSYTSHGWPLADILHYDELVEGLTPETLRRAAERYLAPDRYVLGVLLPETGPGPSTGES